MGGLIFFGSPGEEITLLRRRANEALLFLTLLFAPFSSSHPLLRHKARKSVLFLFLHLSPYVGAFRELLTD